jgi:glutamate synthase (NADPH/NADH) small chain
MLTWPDWPLKLRTSSSHEEGAERDFAVLTTKFSGENGRVKKLHCTRVDGKIKPIPGPNSSSTPIWCCWRWASCIPCTTA